MIWPNVGDTVVAKSGAKYTVHSVSSAEDILKTKKEIPAFEFSMDCRARYGPAWFDDFFLLHVSDANGVVIAIEREDVEDIIPPY